MARSARARFAAVQQFETIDSCPYSAPNRLLRGVYHACTFTRPLARKDGELGTGETSGRDWRRHRQEGARHVPEQLPVGGERDRMRGTRQDDELTVAVRQQVKEFLKIGDGGDAVI